MDTDTEDLNRGESQQGGDQPNGERPDVTNTVPAPDATKDDCIDAGPGRNPRPDLRGA